VKQSVDDIEQLTKESSHEISNHTSSVSNDVPEPDSTSNEDLPSSTAQKVSITIDSPGNRSSSVTAPGEIIQFKSPTRRSSLQMQSLLEKSFFIETDDANINIAPEV
jgi:hypothetical protein